MVLASEVLRYYDSMLFHHIVNHLRNLIKILSLDVADLGESLDLHQPDVLRQVEIRVANKLDVYTNSCPFSVPTRDCSLFILLNKMEANKIADKHGNVIHEGDYVFTKIRGGTHEGKVSQNKFLLERYVQKESSLVSYVNFHVGGRNYHR
jgi:hypothetical protein